MESLFDSLNIGENVIWEKAVRHRSGRRGCKLSHLSVIKKAAERNYKNVLIFEDDATPTPCFDLESLHKSITLLNQQDWDLFYLGGRVVSPAIDLGDSLFKASLMSTHSYCINESAYERVSQKLMKSKLPIDRFYAGFPKNAPRNWGRRAPENRFNCYAVNPPLFFQDPNLGTDIGLGADRREAFLDSYVNRKCIK